MWWKNDAARKRPKKTSHSKVITCFTSDCISFPVNFAIFCRSFKKVVMSSPCGKLSCAKRFRQTEIGKVLRKMHFAFKEKLFFPPPRLTLSSLVTSLPINSQIHYFGIHRFLSDFFGFFLFKRLMGSSVATTQIPLELGVCLLAAQATLIEIR